MSTEGERAERLMAMGQMAASMAHEIRNPLGGMELFCSLLVKELKDDEQRKGMAEQILKGIKTVDRVIQNCLQFARDITPQPSTVTEIEKYLSEGAELLTAGSVKIEFAGDAEIVCNFDPHLIRQVITNLISNGVDAVNEKVRHGSTAAPTVVVKAELEGTDTLLITVSDTGGGISDEIKEKIFDPFMTTKSRGTGLGLAISEAIVRAHNGLITVSNNSEGGATFNVRLPGAVVRLKRELTANG